ncbi:hypothetical protein K492DRAFT_185173 [Lichtheimia hyalospora FSU 10163]|nr:hypothetical protein K492DRAFT_185173 [Lichtheimia hyalospora FSU 10163]
MSRYRPKVFTCAFCDLVFSTSTISKTDHEEKCYQEKFGSINKDYTRQRQRQPANDDHQMEVESDEVEQFVFNDRFGADTDYVAYEWDDDQMAESQVDVHEQTQQAQVDLVDMQLENDQHSGNSTVDSYSSYDQCDVFPDEYLNPDFSNYQTAHEPSELEQEGVTQSRQHGSGLYDYTNFVGNQPHIAASVDIYRSFIEFGAPRALYEQVIKRVNAYIGDKAPKLCSHYLSGKGLEMSYPIDPDTYCHRHSSSSSCLILTAVI